MIATVEGQRELPPSDRTELPDIQPVLADESLRQQLRRLRESGEASNQSISAGCRVSTSVISQYLAEKGCKYPGDVPELERRIRSYLDRRATEYMAGIPTIETVVTRNIANAAKALRQMRLMGKAIGPAGIGKTRAAQLLAEDPSVILMQVTGETGNRESVRQFLCKALGIMGPRKQRAGDKRMIMHNQLIAKLRGANMLLCFDQAHRLTLRAMDYLCELWNDTQSPQLWIGTYDLINRLERDEQNSSRVRVTYPLRLVSDKSRDDVTTLVTHQIRSRIPDIGGEMKALVNRCAKEAVEESPRVVEMRLANMLLLRSVNSNSDTSWIDLYDKTSQFLSGNVEEN